MSTDQIFQKDQENSNIVRNVNELRAKVKDWQGDGLQVGLVPTMGGIHAGHLSLVHKSAEIADRTVASIFVNPTQFAPHEDLESYPRDENADASALTAAGADLIFCPSATEMYPEGFQTSISVNTVSTGLCGTSRPHFFGGVATVVCKLLNQCGPDMALFGEKDYQQLLVIRRMTQDLDMPVEIVGAPIIREKDGLAMSSRNVYLSAEERRVATTLNQEMSKAIALLAGGNDVPFCIAGLRAKLLENGFTDIDYLEVRNGHDLTPITSGSVRKLESPRLFAAAQLGRTRLIDNMAIFKE